MPGINPEVAINQTKDAYNHIATAYSRCWSNDPCMQERLDRFSNYLPKNGLVIDAGCGTGRDIKYLCSQKFRTIGVDFSEAMLGEANSIFPEGAFAVMDMRKLGFPAAICDGIWASASVIHLPRTEIHNILDEMHRILKTRGILFLSMQEGIGERFAEDGRFFVYYHRDEIGAFLKQHEFEILEFETNQSVKNTFKKSLVITWINFFAQKIG